MGAGWRNSCLLTSAMVFLMSCATPPAAPNETPPAAPPPATQPVEQPAVEQPAAPKEFVATEELKKKTFDEVQQVIDALDRIIAAADYDQWLGFLTADYERSRGSEEFLKDASGAPVLKKNGIVLTTLKDYFDNVVVRSHLQATLNDITFVDATHVKAYTRIQGTLYILYYLVREDGRWKIGILPSGGS